MVARTLLRMALTLVLGLTLLDCVGDITPDEEPDASADTGTPGGQFPPVPDAMVTPGPPILTTTESRALPVPMVAMNDLYVSPSGSDENPGTRERPFRNLWAAWRVIPNMGPLTRGVRINLARGRYGFDRATQNTLSDRTATEAAPIFITSPDGPGAAVVEGGLSLRNVRYLYLTDLQIEAGGALGAFDNNVMHLERCDHVLLRRLTVVGRVVGQFQEVIKANQSTHLYVEDCDISGCLQAALDYLAVRYGAIQGNRIHGAGDWCGYIKGGSAYLRVEGNEFWDCPTGGFSVGEGAGLEYMEAPYLQHEAYDIKVVNNVVHDTPGSAFGVYGGFNVLVAHNTAYRVAYNNQGGASIVVVNHGGRVCAGEGGSDALCRERLDLGGWGLTAIGREAGGNFIPGRNVYVFNNLFYNPAGVQTEISHFALTGTATLPPTTRNVPSPSRVDDGLIIRGNLIWNGPRDLLSGAGDEGGCPRTNALCNERQLREQNTINTVEPQLVNPAMGDYRPLAGGNVLTARTYPIPELPSERPSLSSGMTTPGWVTSNTVSRDRDNAPRAAVSPPGAWAVGATR